MDLHSKTNSSLTYLTGEVKLSEYIKENYKQVFIAMMISAIWYTLVVSPYYLLIKPSMPESVAEGYIKCLKDKDYEKAVSFYKDMPSKMASGSEYVKASLERKYGNIEDIRIKHAEASKTPGIYDIMLSIERNGSIYEESISVYNTERSMFGIKKDWKVLFPFKTRDIVISGMDGSRIFIDGIEAGEIKDGKLLVSGIICDMHNFQAKLGDIAKSHSLDLRVTEQLSGFELKVSFADSFKKDMEKLIDDFCKGWSDYCLTQNADNIRPYLTDRLFAEYTKDGERFIGSKYLLSEYTVEFGELYPYNENNVFYNVDEKWHIKEVITDNSLVFRDNYRPELEQTQFMKWKYSIVNDGGKWKLDSAKQIDFKQEIKY